MNRPFPSDPRLRMALAGVALATALAVLPAQAGRIDLRASLAPSAATQHGSGYALQARLEPVHAERLVQLGTTHAMTASLSVSPMVCYGDTIFRDGFNDFWP